MRYAGDRLRPGRHQGRGDGRQGPACCWSRATRAAISKLSCRNSRSRHSKRAEVREYTLSHYGWDKAAEQYTALMRELISVSAAWMKRVTLRLKWSREKRSANTGDGRPAVALRLERPQHFFERLGGGLLEELAGFPRQYIVERAAGFVGDDGRCRMPWLSMGVMPKSSVPGKMKAWALASSCSMTSSETLPRKVMSWPPSLRRRA